MAGKLRLTGKMAVIGKKMLKKVCQILDENNIKYNLDNGTLLGIIREDRLLPWDNDIDITIHEKYLSQLLKLRWKFWLAGYRTRLRYSKIDIKYFPKGKIRMMKVQTRKFLFKGSNMIELYFKVEDNDKYYYIEDEKDPVLKAAPAKYYTNLIRYNFDDYKYLIPKDYEEYLVYRYGDWKTPDKEFNYKKDDLAIVNPKNQ
ncbi:MAG: LicD family protein [Candidatus Cloacimonetes bacterium]|nr:LicD family protein [Candidatus Cloacimonadota bacterium]